MAESSTDRGLSSQPDAIREVFLSPRVVDREAFNDYAGSLRRLIEQAGGQAEALRAAAQDADVAKTALKELAGKHQAKFDLASKVLAGLDQRAAEAEKLLGAARDAVASLDALRTEADRIVADHVARLETRLEGVFGDVQTRLARLEHDARAHADDAKRSLDHVVESAATQMNAQVRALHDQTLAEHGRIMASTDARVAQAKAELDQVVQGTIARTDEQVLDADARVARAKAELDQVINGAMARTEERASAAVASVDAAQKRAAERALELASAIENATREGDLRVREQQSTLNVQAARLEDLIAESETLIGWTSPTLPGAAEDDADELTPVPGSLSDMLAQSRSAREQTQSLLTQLTSLSKQGEQVRGILGSTLVEATERVDRLSERAVTVGEAVDKALLAAHSASAALNSQRSALEAALAAPVEALEARGHSLTHDLETVCHKAQISREAAESVMSDTWAVVQSLEKLLVELRPWKPLLVDGNESAMPAPVAKIIEGLRGDLSRDLSVIAAGMYQIALKAQRLGESVQSDLQ